MPLNDRHGIFTDVSSVNKTDSHGIDYSGYLYI